MKMGYRLRPFGEENVVSATALFADNYRQSRRENPLLPQRVEDEPEWISGNLRALRENTGTTIWYGNEMLGYMVTGAYFTYKGQRTAWIPEYAHASIADDRSQLYRLMYMALAEGWVRKGAHLHLICHLSSDKVLGEVLWTLGFGAVVTEQVRDLSPVEMAPSLTIVNEKDTSRLIDIEREHRLYYRESPIFVLKDPSRHSIEGAFREHIDSSDQIFVYYEDSRPLAYLIVGEAVSGAEGFLFRNTDTAQVKSAYAKPEARGRGIGASLLNRAIEWAKENGCGRLFVEHETANLYGGGFWNKHFSPAVYVSMRYIDTGV